ncbi:hypothetical protein R3P38DRAFT_3444445, partial [Favolaschia claudopus]
PLNIPELLNECLAYYHSSPGDLAAFALVARCWVAVAQLHLYRAPNPSSSSFRGGNFRLRANQLYQTLSTNADLCSMVRELTLNEHHIGDGLDKIATVQLTHLRTLSITLTELRQTQPTPALAHILAQPMLCALYFTSYRYSFPSFNVCWKHCSPNVRHLEIDTNFPSYKTTGSATLQLESLRLGLSMGILEHVHPLHYSDFYPFDLSKLKALSIYLQLPVCWNDLIRCETIKVLELYGGRVCGF